MEKLIYRFVCDMIDLIERDKLMKIDRDGLE